MDYSKHRITGYNSEGLQLSASFADMTQLNDYLRLLLNTTICNSIFIIVDNEIVKEIHRD